MLPVALEYPPGDWNGLCVYRPARGGRLCDCFGGYKTINRIPLSLPLICNDMIKYDIHECFQLHIKTHECLWCFGCTLEIVQSVVLKLKEKVWMPLRNWLSKFGAQMYIMDYMSMCALQWQWFNPFNAEATFIQSTMTLRSLNLSCWYSLVSSLSTLRWVPIC